MIKLFVIGNVGNDAEVKEINGRRVINFSIAHNEKYKNHEGVPVTKTVWVRCNYWPESTAVAAFLKKGTQVFVEGTPSVQAFENNERKPAASLELRVNRIELLGSPENKTENPNQPVLAGAASVPPELKSNGGDDSDLPF